MFSRRQDMAREAELRSEPLAYEAEHPSAQPAGRLGRSVIQPDLVIQGAVLARGELELHGLVQGDVVARSVVVGPSATILGDILGERVSIFGSVQGRVSGHQVHLGADARYQGDIRRDLIAIDDGAQFEGSVRSLGEEERREIAERLAAAAPTRPAAPASHHNPDQRPFEPQVQAPQRPREAPRMPFSAPRSPSMAPRSRG